MPPQASFGINTLMGFVVWGSADLVYAFYRAGQSGIQAGQLGSTYFIVTLLVPLLLITHGLVFRLLLRRDDAIAAREAQHAV